ncbi:MAG: outer membrane protein assembly factor BamA [Gemmatimonadota bacterium]
MRSAAAGVALALAALAFPLGAQEVSLEPRETPLAEVPDQAPVEGFEIVGADAFSQGAIQRRLYTEASSGFLFFGETRRLNKEEFLRDLRRVVVFYQQNGYFDADVEGYGARVDTEGGVDLSIFVHEGEPSHIDTLRMVLAGGDTAAASPEHDDPTPEELLELIPLQEGDVFSEARIDSAQAILMAEFQNLGHAFADVLKEYSIRKDARSATVTFSVHPGDVYRFGGVTIEGETEVSEKLIRGQVQFSPGDLFRLDQVYATQRRLYQLNLFRRAQVEPQYEAAVGDSLPVVIQVADAEEHLVRLGVGYGTEDSFRATASWLDRNFLGGARQANVTAEYSNRRRGASTSLTQPNVLLDDLSATGTLFYAEELEDTYRVRRTGGSGRINHEVSSQLRTFYGFNVERDDFRDVERLEDIQDLLGQEFLNPSTLSFLELGALFDSSDDLFSPTEGNTASLNYHFANTLLTGDYRYHRITVLATHYQQVRRGWILALKVLPGLIQPFGAATTAEDSIVAVPLFERLFAGGSTSVRGYQRRRLGPLAGEDCEANPDDCDPVGGEALLEASAELRFPLFGNFRGVAFVDAGNVWIDPGDVSLSDLRYTPGVGLRYDTPVGPVRVDMGVKTRGADPGPAVVLHFSIGNAF